MKPDEIEKEIDYLKKEIRAIRFNLSSLNACLLIAAIIGIVIHEVLK